MSFAGLITHERITLCVHALFLLGYCALHTDICMLYAE